MRATRRARTVDAFIIGAAAVCWVIAATTSDATLNSVGFIAASSLTTLSLFRPWCRSLARETIVAATWAAEREREQASAEAKRHAEHWRAIVDTATEGIVTIDKAGIIATANDAAAQMFGYSEAELLGRNVKILMPPPYEGEHDEYLRRYLQTGERRIIGIGREVTGRRKDGSRFPIDLSVGEGAAEDRKFFTAVIRDITDRKELQTKLAQAERLAAVGELAAGVAHEVNNPINTVINCAQLIRDGDDPTGNSGIIVEEGERIADIVRDLLQFARDDRDRAQPTSMPEIVQRTLRLVSENWKRHGIQLEVDVPNELPDFLARSQQIQQVLLNLLINAKQALVATSSSDRRVRLQAAVVNDGIQVRVADNGPGIPPDLRDRVFEPFITTKRASGGTGLGLSISKSIVEGYGGTLTLASEPGSGAEFTLWLPLAKQG